MPVGPHLAVFCELLTQGRHCCMVLRNGKERLVLGRGSCPDVLCLRSQPSIPETACSSSCLQDCVSAALGCSLSLCFPLKAASCQESWTFSGGPCWPWAWQLMLVMKSHSALIQCFRHCDWSWVCPPGTSVSFPSLIRSCYWAISWECQCMVRSWWLL